MSGVNQYNPKTYLHGNKNHLGGKWINGTYLQQYKKVEHSKEIAAFKEFGILKLNMIEGTHTQIGFELD